MALLEREGERAALAAVVAAACGGQGQVVAVEGAAGIGKTRLLAEGRAEAGRAGMRVLTARGMELEREFAYGVVRQLFEPVMATASEAERAEVLAGAAGQAGVLFAPSGPVAAPSLGGDASFAVVHGLFWLTVNLCARGPVLLCVDDLQWSDAPSLRFLVHLLPRLEGLALAVLVALRPAEPEVDQRLLDQITTDPLVELLHPAPLSQAGSAQLVRAVTSGAAQEAFCIACHEVTGGNPLLLRELVNVAVAEGVAPTAAGVDRLVEIGSRAVGRRVTLSLARLGSNARAVCGAVAILGDGADPARVAVLAGLELPETLETARRLVEVEILHWSKRSRPHGMLLGLTGRLQFVHPLIRGAVYEGLSETQRLAGHGRAARVLMGAGAAAEKVAAHVLVVPPAGDAEVVAVLRRAAAEAAARGSPESAVAYLERCLAEPPSEAERVDVLVQLGTAAQLIDMTKAMEYLSQALDLTEDAKCRAVIADILGRTLLLAGRYDEAVGVYSQAAKALGDQHTDLRRRLEAGVLGVALADPALLGVAADYVTRLRELPADSGLGGRRLDTTIALYDALSGAPVEVAVARARRGLADGVLIEQVNAVEPLVYGCLVLMAADLDEVIPLFDAWLAQAYRHGSTLSVGGAKCFRGLAWLWRGSLVEAETNARDAMAAIEAVHTPVGRPFAGANLADALMEQGRLEEAEAALNWADIPDLLPRASHWPWVLDSHARLLLLQGHTAQGLARLLARGRWFTDHGWHNPAFATWRSEVALALLKLDRRDEAQRLAGEDLDWARRWGAPRALGRALRVAGLIRAGEEGLALLREAAAVLAPSPARLEYAKALIELGAALRRAGQRVEAREHLREGVEQAHTCGARPLVKQGWAELRASGGRLRWRTPSGPAALTPSERRVAELAAAGLSNRDIAQQLFITINTVEVHLTRTYRKLGVNSRTDLAQALLGPSTT